MNDVSADECEDASYGRVTLAGKALADDDANNRAEWDFNDVVFTALNNVHTATRAGTALSALDKRLVFGLALTFEQEVTVAPGVEAEVARFDCPVLTFLCLRPLVRFLYFPKRRYFWFRNFANKTERIAKAMASYDLAERIGWSNVEAAMQLSPVLPAAFWSDPSAFVRSKLA